jgi:hypothetical protein
MPAAPAPTTQISASIVALSANSRKSISMASSQRDKCTGASLGSCQNPTVDMGDPIGPEIRSTALDDAPLEHCRVVGAAEADFRVTEQGDQYPDVGLLRMGVQVLPPQSLATHEVAEQSGHARGNTDIRHLTARAGAQTKSRRSSDNSVCRQGGTSSDATPRTDRDSIAHEHLIINPSQRLAYVWVLYCAIVFIASGPPHNDLLGPTRPCCTEVEHESDRTQGLQPHRILRRTDIVRAAERQHTVQGSGSDRNPGHLGLAARMQRA